MNCLWLILILACCGSCFGNQNDSSDDGCGCGNSRASGGGGNRRRDNDCDCDCGRNMPPMPPFGRGADSDTCGCDIQEQ
jgi:hypothetical protein